MKQVVISYLHSRQRGPPPKNSTKSTIIKSCNDFLALNPIRTRKQFVPDSVLGVRDKGSTFYRATCQVGGNHNEPIAPHSRSTNEDLRAVEIKWSKIATGDQSFCHLLLTISCQIWTIYGNRVELRSFRSNFSKIFFPHFLFVQTKTRMIETHADLCSKMRDFHARLYLHK